MSWEFFFDDENKITRCVFHTSLLTKDVNDSINEGLSFLRSKDSNKIIVDCRDVRKITPVEEFVYHASIFEEKDIPVGFQMAYLIPEDMILKTSFQFFIGMLKEKGFFVDHFESENEAIDWLTE